METLYVMCSYTIIPIILWCIGGATGTATATDTTRAEVGKDQTAGCFQTGEPVSQGDHRTTRRD